jgi:hypothetical protein
MGADAGGTGTLLRTLAWGAAAVSSCIAPAFTRAAPATKTRTKTGQALKGSRGENEERNRGKGSFLRGTCFTGWFALGWIGSRCHPIRFVWPARLKRTHCCPMQPGLCYPLLVRIARTERWYGAVFKTAESLRTHQGCSPFRLSPPPGDGGAEGLLVESCKARNYPRFALRFRKGLG